MIFSNPAASAFAMVLQRLYSSFFRCPSSAIQRPVTSITDTASMAPLTVAERHRIWLRLCQLADSSIQAVQAAQVPSDAIPPDAPDAPPQSAADFIAAILAADLPADPAQAQEIRDLLTDLQRVISLHKFDVSTVDPAKHGYFRIDTGDAEPYWES